MDRWAEACLRRREQTEELGMLVVEEVAAFQRLTGSGGAGAFDDMLDSTASLRRLLGRYVVSANRCHECFPDFQEKIDEEEIREMQLRIGEVQEAIRKRKRARD